MTESQTETNEQQTDEKLDIDSAGNTEDVKAVYLAADDLKLAASLLYQSYFDDPLFMEIFNHDKPEYDKRLRVAIREELNAFWEAKEPMVGLFAGDRMLGVACVVTPGSVIGEGRFWHWRLKMLLTSGFMSTKQMLEKEERIRETIPEEHYHMLAFIAVHPNHQKHGLGKYLMKAVDSIVSESLDSKGVGVFVTLDKYMEFFSNEDYQFIDELSFGSVSGKLLFRYRQGGE